MSSKKRTGSSSIDSRDKLRSGSRSGLNTSSSSKLRMDSRPQQPRITDPSLPAGRRREIDTVMKKARSSPNSNGYWDKKLLEVEAKDPNRWRHSGYKQMYIGGSSSPSPPSHRRRTRSRSRSYGGRRSPPPSSAPRRPRSPPHRPPTRRSPSASSVSSCSDDSCSVCSPKNRTRDRRLRSRSRSYSVPRSRAKPPPSRSKPVGPPPSGGKSSSRIRPPSPPPAASKGAKPPSDPRRAPAVAPSRVRATHHEIQEITPTSRMPPRASMSAAQVSLEAQRARDKANRKKKERKDKEKNSPVLLTRIKTERKNKRRRSPAAAESSGSEDSSSSELSAVVQSTRLTLSERFGKMAQWSVDRRDIENMRITKNSNSGDLKVMIEAEERMYDSPPLRYSHSPAPIGHYPEELLASGPSGMTAWDDVRVRYQYYKDLGYLRDLTLDDYIKWEQWWYKYQEWLKNERYYEHWISSQNRRRRKRIPATQRLN